MSEDKRIEQRDELVYRYCEQKPYNPATDALLVQDFVRGASINKKRETIKKEKEE